MATDSTTIEDTVGWQTGPEDRGTVTLIWGCVTTIFACSWTILHLNVPALTDSDWTKILRKTKWMLITIIFPEFILSKAICDLRLALQELGEVDDYLQSYGHGMDWGEWGSEWSWRVEYPRLARLLCRLLFLKPRHVNNDEEAHDEEEHDEEAPRQAIERTQKWTIVHSYFAQMGGLAYTNSTDERYLVLTASKLTPRYRWTSKYTHPMKQVILGRQDIEDKSKADSFVKSVAVLQIVWLVLNVIARAIKELPITQLEVATIAFAVMATLTYAINWWKPKDVFQPIRLLHTGSGMPRRRERSSDEAADLMQCFMVRLRRPHIAVKASREMPDIERVPNDLVWMEGSTPLFYQLLGISSLLFGSLHCIAWNFEFPTTIELHCWRVASLVSATLPGIALGLSIVVGYLRTAYFVRKGTSLLLQSLQPLECIGQERWKYITSPEFSKWSERKFNAFLAMPKDRNTNWEACPRFGIVQQPRESRTNTYVAHMSIVSGLQKFHELWQCMLEGERECHRLRFGEEWLSECKWLVQSFRDSSREYDSQDFWRGYEIFIDQKLGIPPEMRLGTSCLEMIVQVYENKIQVLESRLDLATKVVEGLNWCGGIIYIACRLATIVLLFTCLRAAPTGVYQVVPWTTIIPGIS